ncbi:MAG: response regulator [Bacteriovoracaceae bacterium]
MLELQNETNSFSYQSNYSHLEKHKRKKILIIDDEIDFRLTLAELLTLQGYGVCTARDGIGALNYLLEKEEVPDLIILDLNMPNMNGWDFLKQIDANDVFSKIPLMIVSGDFMVHEEEFSGRLRPVLLKPIDRLQMFQTIENLLSDSE